MLPWRFNEICFRTVPVVWENLEHLVMVGFSSRWESQVVKQEGVLWPVPLA